MVDQEPTSQPQSKDEYPFVAPAEAMQFLSEVFRETNDVRRRVDAANGIVAYYLAHEIASLIDGLTTQTQALQGYMASEMQTQPGPKGGI